MTKITREQFTKAVGTAPVQDDLNRANCELAGTHGHEQCGWSWLYSKPIFMLNSTEVKASRIADQQRIAEPKTEAPPVWAPKHGHQLIINKNTTSVIRNGTTVHECGFYQDAVQWVKDEEARIDAVPKPFSKKKHPYTKNEWHIVDPDGHVICTAYGEEPTTKLIDFLNRT